MTTRCSIFFRNFMRYNYFLWIAMLLVLFDILCKYFSLHDIFIFFSKIRYTHYTFLIPTLHLIQRIQKQTAAKECRVTNSSATLNKFLPFGRYSLCPMDVGVSLCFVDSWRGGCWPVKYRGEGNWTGQIRMWKKLGLRKIPKYHHQVFQGYLPFFILFPSLHPGQWSAPTHLAGEKNVPFSPRSNFYDEIVSYIPSPPPGHGYG